MSKSKISILLLTKDHPESVKAILSAACTAIPECDYLLLDSSDPLRAREIEEACGRGPWRYLHLDPGMTSDEKWVYSLSHFEGEYLWVIGDGVIPDIKALRGWLLQKISEHPDGIHLVNADARSSRAFFASGHIPEELSVHDAEQGCLNFFWTATFMGATLLSREMAAMMAADERLPLFINTGFAIPCLLFEALAKKKGTLLVALRHYYYPNPHKNQSIWMQKGETFEIWSEKLPRAVRALSGDFDGVKEEIVNTACVRNGYYGLRWMLQWRARGILNPDTLKRYKDSLLKMSRFGGRELWLLSRLPKWFCRLCIMPFEIRTKLKYG